MHADLPGPDMVLVEEAVRTRADRIPTNPETGMFDPYPARMADGLVELAATSADKITPSVQVTLFADLEALTEDSGTTGVAELSGVRSLPAKPLDRLPATPPSNVWSPIMAGSWASDDGHG
jgi:hypothetical protein